MEELDQLTLDELLLLRRAVLVVIRKKSKRSSELSALEPASIDLNASDDFAHIVAQLRHDASRDEQARKLVQEYIDDQNALIKRLRKEQ